MKNTLLKVILDQIKLAGGVSVDLKMQQIVRPLNFWYFPKHPSKTELISIDKDLEKELLQFIKKHKTLLTQKKTVLGVWLNSNNNSYYLDITTWENKLENAVEKAKQISHKEGRKIVTVFNPVLDKTQYVWNDVLE